MKFFKINFLLILICLISVTAFGQKKKKKDKSTASVVIASPLFQLKNKIDTVSYSIGTSIGKMVKDQGLDSVNTDAVAQGFADLFKKNNLLISPEQANQLLQVYFTALYQKKTEAAKATGKKYLEENKTKPGVIVLPSGLQYQVLVEGKGAKPKATDKVKVNYTGKLIDGSTFDTSIGKEPVVLGLNQVITGWTEGMQLMNVGSKFKLFIPFELGYGDKGSGPIPAFSTLIFEIELIGIEK